MRAVPSEHSDTAGATPPAPSHGGGASRLVVLAGPTAVGKGTVSAYVREHHPQVWMSVSATTRPPRPGEVDGLHYHFLAPEDFEARVAAGEFLEHAVVHGRNRYGTLRAPVREALAAGRPALLEIDLQGARQVREAMPEALFVFLAPPSWDELVRRLVGRGTETEAERATRLATARVELAAAEEFDVTIVNDDVARAAEQLVSLTGRSTPTDASHLPAASRAGVHGVTAGGEVDTMTAADDVGRDEAGAGTPDPATDG